MERLCLVILGAKGLILLAARGTAPRFALGHEITLLALVQAS